MYDDVELTRKADEDLRRIGGWAEKTLFLELDRLPSAPRSEFVELVRREPAEPVRLRWRIGEFVAVFHEQRETRSAGIERVVAVVDRVVPRRALEEWLEREVQAATDRDESLPADDDDESTDD